MYVNTFIFITPNSDFSWSFLVNNKPTGSLVIKLISYKYEVKTIKFSPKVFMYILGLAPLFLNPHDPR